MKKTFTVLKIIFLFITPSLTLANIVNLSSGKPSPELISWVTNEMHLYNIPGASIVVIKNYQISWAAGFGMRDKATKNLVNNNTLFQAASISKPFAAMAALETFHNKNISINANINTLLTSWKIPNNNYTQKQPVTLKLLLSHTAGITGFREKGYSTQDTIPDLLAILNGQPPANTPPIIVVRQPNTRFEYSPASYTIVQATLVDIYKQPFDEIMQNIILTPLGMTHSTFSQPLPKSYYRNIAWPYLPNGKLVANGPYIFPTSAAGGLWSTPSDIAEFIIAIQKALRGKTVGNITPQLAQEMLTPGLNHNMGLGVEVNVNRYGELSTKNADYFRHSGFQTGYLAIFVASKKTGNGIVIMCNSAPYMTEPNVPQYDFLAKTVKHISMMENWQ